MSPATHEKQYWNQVNSHASRGFPQYVSKLWACKLSFTKGIMQSVRKELYVHVYIELQERWGLASFPGSRVGEEEREPGTHMRQVPLVTCILLCYTKITVNSVYLLKGRTAWLYSLWDTYGQFLSQKLYRFDSNCLYCFVRSKRWTSKGRDCISHVLQCFAGIHEHVENSCKRRPEYLCRSFVIVYTERGQWHASFIQEKLAYLAEVSVTEQILRKFPNSQKSWGNWACANSVYVPGSFFSAHTQEPGNEASWG